MLPDMNCCLATLIFLTQGLQWSQVPSCSTYPDVKCDDTQLNSLYIIKRYGYKLTNLEYLIVEKTKKQVFFVFIAFEMLEKI